MSGYCEGGVYLSATERGRIREIDLDGEVLTETSGAAEVIAALSEKPMSEENVEIAKSLFAAFADRDFEAAAEVLDPSLEIRPGIVGGPEGVVYRGPDGMRQFWTDVDVAWAEFRITTEEFREIDQEVLVLGRAFARGRGSGITLDAPAAWMVGLLNGRIVRFQSFSSPQEALEAAGLSE